MKQVTLPALVALLFSCSDGDSGPTADRTVPVKTVRVERKTREDVLSLMGTVEAEREVKVGFKIGGRITKLAFEEGDPVAKDAVLAELDVTDLAAQKEKAAEGVKKAQRDLNRMGELYKANAVPLARKQDAESLLITAKAELTIIEDALENSVLKAPFAGRISRKLSEIGEVVGPGAPVAILTEMDPILVKAAVPDNLIARVARGQNARVCVANCPGEEFAGEVARTETSADPLTRTFRAEIRLANPDEKLRPGIIARVEIVVGEGRPALLVPLDAVVGLGAQPRVFVVRDGKAVRRTIAVGGTRGNEVEVTDGLGEGETVVVSGQEYLRDGDAVVEDK
ncbi:MAG: efflux RND transporter periplasmic adaptor subunit [Planctomycetota bacterium]|jgi:membrane fusion protein (multidrug efflux system)